jgi:serine/threonine-protein phosphatase 2B catalytic subunit
VKTIIRAHEVFPEGYQKYNWGGKKGSDFPTVVTVFSAPNYCGVYGNKGAIIKIEVQIA